MKKATSKKPTAVALMSGGMDSCVTAMIAMKKYDVSAMFASYGQRTANRERRAFRALTKKLGIARTLEIDLRHIKAMGGSALTDPDAPVPLDRPTVGVPSTYVPFRNGVLVSTAAAWAEAIGARAIFIGAVAVDGPEGYPDTTRKFFDAMERAIDVGTRPETKIKIETPLVYKDKTAVVEMGTKLGAPFELTWSCYVAEKVACGRCLSCLGRMKAFRAAGVEDPIPYFKINGPKK